jgi:hypothetical protein
VQIAFKGRERVVFGQGFYEEDCDYGRVLRIVPYSRPDDAELMLVEGAFNGRIQPGDALNCDYLIRLA